jgi:hypothetical protein
MTMKTCSPGVLAVTVGTRPRSDPSHKAPGRHVRRLETSTSTSSRLRLLLVFGMVIVHWDVNRAA